MLTTILTMPAVMVILIGVVVSIEAFSITETILQTNDSNLAFAEDDSASDEQNDQARTGNSKYADDIATGYENSFLVLNVLANDRKEIYGYDDSISIQSVSEPSFGTVMVNSDNTIIYMPNGQRLPSGSVIFDSFEYFAVVHNNEGDIDSDLYYDAPVRLQIIQVNDAPLTFDSSYSVSNNRILSSYLPAYDEDGDKLTFSMLLRPELGEIISFEPGTGRFHYVPYNNSVGYDSFTYTTSDGVSTSALGVATITVLDSTDNNSDDYPVTDQQAVEGDDSYDYYDDDYYYNNDVDSNSNDTSSLPSSNESEEQPKPVAKASAADKEVLAGALVILDGLASYDPEGDAITYLWSQTRGSTVSLSGSNSASASFVAPSVNTETTLIFQLVVSDGQVASDPSTISITVFPIPVIQVDILPGTYPNEINTNKIKETIPVAILGSSYVDVSIIVEESLEFGPNSATVASIRSEDSNSDGFTDLVAYFNIGELGLKENDTKACMTGLLSISSTALPFNVCDSVKIVNKNTG